MHGKFLRVEFVLGAQWPRGSIRRSQGRFLEQKGRLWRSAAMCRGLHQPATVVRRKSRSCRCANAKPTVVAAETVAADLRTCSCHVSNAFQRFRLYVFLTEAVGCAAARVP